MDRVQPRGARPWKYALPLMAIAAVVLVTTAGTTQAGPTALKGNGPKFTEAVAFDVSKPLKELAKGRQAPSVDKAALSHGPDGMTFEPAASSSSLRFARPSEAARTHTAGGQQALAIPSPIQNFEGLSNQDNFNTFGFRVNPPDPNGDVGPNHYVEMINLVFAVYSKTGTLLLGPVDTGTLWSDFAVPDCTDPSGDPIVLYDQITDRWILSQFTTRGFDDPTLPFFNCVAISQTGDPTGAYFRYASSLRQTRMAASSSRTIRSTACGRTRTCSRRATSGPSTATESASTRSRRTRWSTATPRPAPCSLPRL